MSINDKLHIVDIKKDSNIAKLVNELCAMTECDQEQAYVQLSSCDFNFESAANKILESSSINEQVTSEWQLINRQKKSKKKQDKVEVKPSSDAIKKFSDLNRHTKYKVPNQNQKPENFTNEDKLNNQNRAHRNRKNRFNNHKPNEMAELQTTQIHAAVEPYTISDSENELRWDYVADIEGGFKESSVNSQGDGFYSEDDICLSSQLDDHSYRGLSTQLVSDINQKYKPKINNSDNVVSSEQSCSSQAESQNINDFLTNQLPIFGNFSITQPPPSISIVPVQPVSFYRDIKPKKVFTRRHYNFGINIKDELTIANSKDSKFRNLSDEPVQITTSPEQVKVFTSMNTIAPVNDPNVNQMFHPPGIISKDYTGILNTIMNQQKVVAMMFGNHPPTSYYEYPKPINMISMPNSNHMEQLYSMNIHPGLHPNMENGMTIQSQDGFVPQTTFLTSNNMSVPFHANRK